MQTLSDTSFKSLLPVAGLPQIGERFHWRLELQFVVTEAHPEGYTIRLERIYGRELSYRPPLFVSTEWFLAEWVAKRIGRFVYNHYADTVCGIAYY